MTAATTTADPSAPGGAAPPKRGALGRRAGWGFLDQALSSLTNFGIGIVVAASVSTAQFGTFALVFGAYSAMIGISAGLTSVPLTVRYSAAVGDTLAHAERASVGAALGLGLLGSLGFFATAGIVAGHAAGPLLAMGAVLPGLLTQDTWRYVFMARGRPAQAAANDGCWTALQIVGMSVLLSFASVSVSSLLLVWGGAATGAALFGAWQAGAAPALRRAPRWLKTQWDLAARYAIEMCATRVLPFVVLAGISAFAGVKTVGALRGAQLLVATLPNLLFTGIAFVAVPEGVRLVESQPQRLRRVVRMVSAGAAAATILWCAVAIGGGLLFGRGVLGATWPLARPLLVVTGIGAICTAFSLGPGVGLWILADARRSVRVRVASSLLAFSSVPAAAADGAWGAALAIAVTAALSAALWWWQFTRRQRIAPTRLEDQRDSLAVSRYLGS
jgi:O-antigen/teichoic acid export membrane protein